MLQVIWEVLTDHSSIVSINDSFMSKPTIAHENSTENLQLLTVFA